MCFTCGKEEKKEQRKHGDGLGEWKDDEFHLNKYDIFVEKLDQKGWKPHIWKRIELNLLISLTWQMTW